MVINLKQLCYFLLLSIIVIGTDSVFSKSIASAGTTTPSTPSAGGLSILENDLVTAISNNATNPSAISDFFAANSGNPGLLGSINPGILEFAFNEAGSDVVNALGGAAGAGFNGAAPAAFIDSLVSNGSDAVAGSLITGLSDPSTFGSASASTLAAISPSTITNLESTFPGLVTAVSDINPGVESLLAGGSVSGLVDSTIANAASSVGSALDSAIAGLGLNLTGSVGNLVSSILGSGPASVVGSVIGLVGGTSESGVIGGAKSTDSSLPTSSPISLTCDPNIETAMKTYAWLSAQREVTQTQSIIAKPDSVMELSCFSSYLDPLAGDAKDMMSENEKPWRGTTSIVSAMDMDNALTELIARPAAAFANSAFNHSKLGGRAEASKSLSPRAGSSIIGLPLPIPPAILSFLAAGRRAYTCDQMNKVWRAAKCANFAALSHDGFLTFKQHEGQDTRLLPKPCATPDPRWGSYYTKAIVTPDWRTTAGSAPRTYNVAMGQEYSDLEDYTEPASCDVSRSFKTGIEFADPVTSSTVEDTVCLNPGCIYDGGSCRSK